MGKLHSFARVRVMKGQVEEKGELQLLRNNPLHPRGKLLWLACVDHTIRAEFILCYEL